jgi:hypothetical protein
VAAVASYESFDVFTVVLNKSPQSTLSQNAFQKVIWEMPKTA